MYVPLFITQKKSQDSKILKSLACKGGAAWCIMGVALAFDCD